MYLIFSAQEVTWDFGIWGISPSIKFDGDFLAQVVWIISNFEIRKY